ncbi:aminoglycoside phosphotransferase family protein [Streptomyces sp. TRM66268-LWL]|uniref:Aminoglycoside phosphotransferase family protein n=1 Tax=Streptomyces polyasparticus TaxID=2767826 RepID=A0ABR7SQZ6_9ACTN|nr:aminoglycoside phosphotransferase family protein [Streptomyces polyasparticus]MBC9717829.1 aminoglycoside phosphotransferase family protein [Streptomyces polyasparticus]
MSVGKPLPDPMHAWVTSQIGEIKEVRDAAWPRLASQVWEITGIDRERYFAKVSPSPKFFSHETRAYRFVGPSLGAEHAPRLLGTAPEHLALLVTAMPGSSVPALDLNVTDRQRVHHQAGALLRIFHGGEVLDREGRDEAVAQGERLGDQAAKHVERAGDLLSDVDRDLVRRAIAELPDMAQLPTAYAHGDYQERNWLWSGQRLALIDFERARHTWAVWDLVRLACGPWLGHQELRTAFFDGYGRDLTAAERHAIGCLAAFDAASAISWGTVNDPEVAQRGRATLDRLAMGEPLV